MPDRVHYRMVQCAHCGLVRSDPVLDEAELGRLYAESRLTYQHEAGFAGETYAHYLRELLPLLPEKKRLLEIGCGSGFFLERAPHLGFAEVCGVEPSCDAVEAASPKVRASIRNDSFVAACSRVVRSTSPAASRSLIIRRIRMKACQHPAARFARAA